MACSLAQAQAIQSNELPFFWGLLSLLHVFSFGFLCGLLAWYLRIRIVPFTATLMCLDQTLISTPSCSATNQQHDLHSEYSLYGGYIGWLNYLLSARCYHGCDFQLTISSRAANWPYFSFTITSLIIRAENTLCEKTMNSTSEYLIVSNNNTKLAYGQFGVLKCQMYIIFTKTGSQDEIQSIHMNTVEV